MTDLNFIDVILEKRENIEKESIETLTRIAKILKDKGVSRLGLWSSELIESWEGNKPLYSPEDEECFKDIEAPEDYASFGGDNEYSLGPIFGIEVVDDELVLYGHDSEMSNKINTIPQKEVLSNDWNIDTYDSLVVMIRDSIRINEENNIPTEKWGVAHYSDVDPYTWEPISGKK
ncbi:MAG: hypothetical protein NC453_11455 [Muribaculum sp.]|nr:hypothetical protein [Muribaculum sp.]